MKLISIIVCIFIIPCVLFSQKKQVIIKDNHGSISITTKNYNIKAKGAILNVAKYIDTTKDIRLIAGSAFNSGGFIKMKNLRSPQGIFPFTSKYGAGAGPMDLIGGEEILSIRIVAGKLKINSHVMGFDGKYIAQIINNKLIPARADYHLYVSDKYFELFDDYYIPVLQIELIKERNAIYIGGAFNYETGWTIISKEHGLANRNFYEPTMPMEQHKKDSLFYEYLQTAKQMLTPIHE